MDTSATDITFDESGQCNFCKELENRLESSTSLWASESIRGEQLSALIQKIKQDGKGKPYDCIVGVSGGVDSSWVLVNAVRLGLRPLAVHMDNGWNSDLAVSNIANLIEELEVDLFTYVINWEEYRKLMLAFFEADVIDVELLYDNALHGVCYGQAKKYKLKYILSGSNQSTEGLRMPKGWAWESKWDGANIRGIAKRFGARVETFPIFTTLKWLLDTYLYGVVWVPFLDYVEYKKESALATLEKQFEYRPYPYKHYESVFTRFYQGYLLPEKFGVDKRRVHLSSLIVTGQLSRSQALDDLGKLPFESLNALEADKRFFLKKMGWSEIDLEKYLRRAEISHGSYPSDIVRKIILIAVKILRRR